MLFKLKFKELFPKFEVEKSSIVHILGFSLFKIEYSQYKFIKRIISSSMLVL